MQHRISRALRVALVSTAALGAVVASSLPAQAYPGVPATATGSCSPASQSVTVHSPFASINCTFTYLDSASQPVVGKPFSVTATGASVIASQSVTDSAGQATAMISIPSCSAEGTQTAIVTGNGAGSSTQATATATCTRAIVSVTADNSGTCGVVGTAPDLADGNGSGTKYACSFHTSPADAYPVAYSIDSPGDLSFIKKSTSTSTMAGEFTAEVWSYSGDVFVLTGFVRSTSTYDGGSATAHA